MSDEEELLPGGRRGVEDGPGLVTAFTLVVWIGCVAVGATGLLSQPSGTPAPPTSQPAVRVVSVELESAPAPPSQAQQVAAVTPAAVAEQAPALPSMPTAALPSAAIAFAVPVAGPVRIGPAAAAVPVVRRISAGQEGGNPLTLDYPEEAAAAGQQATVVVRFSTDDAGRVDNAWTPTPTPFPLLNHAAVTAVAGHDWHRPAGLWEYAVTFRLNVAD